MTKETREETTMHILIVTRTQISDEAHDELWELGAYFLLQHVVRQAPP